MGKPLGTSDWREISQSDVDLFAQATADKQWIHVDVERAKTGPYGSTIVHGYMTLALIAPLFADVLTISELGMGVNYGLDKAKFPAPVTVGSRVRHSASVDTAEEIKGGIRIVASITIEATMPTSRYAWPRSCSGATTDCTGPPLYCCRSNISRSREREREPHE
ncbi:MAG: MaoC family dehydratase [Rhodococcus sp. (in: high G+C Gram-positive bacteria)]|uniref:MaoC family dehydratase n=1 Tax=Rhodococcus sp. TaxID=1831 RepID=UPI002AD7E40E|nr:MaoC family dehydratase [Rhodococcus sp. (in: high G+C Gram-positive bacteria)]